MFVEPRRPAGKPSYGDLDKAPSLEFSDRFPARPLLLDGVGDSWPFMDSRWRTNRRARYQRESHPSPEALRRYRRGLPLYTRADFSKNPPQSIRGPTPGAFSRGWGRGFRLFPPRLRPGDTILLSHYGAEHQPVHDTLERDWRHLNFFQFQAYIHAKVLRVRCGTCAKTTPRSWRPGRPPTAASTYGWRPYWSPSVRRWRSLRSLRPLNCLASATGASGAPSIITSIRRTIKMTSRPSPRLVSTRPPRGVDTIT